MTIIPDACQPKKTDGRGRRVRKTGILGERSWSETAFANASPYWGRTHSRGGKNPKEKSVKPTVARVLRE